MQKIELKPLDGIIIENVGKVSLGQHKGDLYRLLGLPSTNSMADRLFYDALEVAIELDNYQKITFIEFIYGPFPVKTELSIYGINPFTIGAEKLLEILSIENRGTIDSSEAPYSYCFLNTSIGVWREVIHENVDTTSDISQLNLNVSDYDNVIEDLEMAQNFWTIGIGVEGYYSV